jgi:hypothetical protein
MSATLTPSAKAKIAAAARCRWAKVRAARAGEATTATEAETFDQGDAKPVEVEVLPAVGKLALNANLKSGGDTAIAKQFNKLFSDAQTGMRRIVALGLFAWEIKERQLKHGQFGDWLAKHCPKLATLDGPTGKPVASRALRGYMDLTKSVLENVGFKTIESYLDEAEKIANTKALKHGGFLLIPDKKVPDEVKPLREKICQLVDGKTQNALFTEFKQADDETGKPKRGRVKGCKGTTAEARAAAAAAEAQAALDELDISAREQVEWALQKADDLNLGMLGEDTLTLLWDAWSNGAAYIKRVLEARKGGAK